MEEPTQTVDLPPGDERILTPPVGYLKVFAQKAVEERNYCVAEGENTIGRSEECDVCIAAKSLSRTHATLLVDGGTHFIQDLGSRNKTYRGKVQLRPNAYYELTDGCDLVFADVKCRYFYGAPAEHLGSGDVEQTQLYEFEEGGERGGAEEGQASGGEGRGGGGGEEEVEGGGGGRGEATEHPAAGSVEDSEVVRVRKRGGGRLESDSSAEQSEPIGDKETVKEEVLPQDSEGSTTAGEEEEGEERDELEGDYGNDFEPTQAYHFPVAEEEEGEGEHEMDCDPTVAYDMEGLPHSDDSPASSPLLGGRDNSPTLLCPKEHTECRDGEKLKHSTLGGRGAGREEEEEEVDGKMTTSRAEGKSDKKTVCFDQTVLYDTSDDDDDESTQPYVPEGTTAKGPTESGVEQTPSDDRGKEGKEEEEGATAKGPTEGGAEGTPGDDRGKEGTAEEEGATMEVEPTVVYHLEEDTPERTMAGGGVDPTVPYVLEESKEDMGMESLPRAHSSRTPGTSGMVAEELGEEDGVVSDIPSGGTNPRKTATKVEQIVPYSLGEESEDVKKGKEEEEKEEEGKEEEEKEEEAKEEEEEEEEEEEKNEGEEALGEKRTTSSVSRGTSKGHPEEQPERRSKSKKDEALSLEEAERMDSPDQSNIRSGGGELPVVGGDHLREEQEKKEEEEKEEGDSIGSDLDATIPALLDASKQKTLFARQRGRGRRGRGGGGRGRGASARRMDTKPAVEEQRGKGRRGKEMKPKAMATTMEVESTFSVAAVGEGVETRGRRGKQRAGRRQRTRTCSKVAADSGAVEGEMETVSTTDVVEFSTGEPNPSVNTSIGSLSEESPDITLHPPGPTEVPKHEDQSSRSPADGDQSGHSSAASSASTPARTDPPVSSGSSSGGRRGRGRGRGRGRRPSTPRKGIAAKPALKSQASITLRHVVPSPSRSTPLEKPHVMFTGMIDKEGEKTVRELGGELVDSVYNCTHLVTDKVRRTVKFLCCLSRGCLIVNDSWLDHCSDHRKFLPAEPFMVKDKNAEKQHKFLLSRSHKRAKTAKLLSGYKIFLTRSIKPERDQMADIIKCAGGEVLSTLPLSVEEGVLIVACEEDIGSCRAAMEAGVLVHSTELILGGVLHQELDLHSHLLALSDTAGKENGRKRRKNGPASSPPPAKRRKRGGV